MPFEEPIKVLLIVNPTAGKMKSKSELFDIINLFRENNYITTTITTASKGDATTIVKQYANEHDMIVCCGGDGTLNEIISGLMQIKSQIPIGYLPAGSTNDMAKTLKLPMNINKAAHAFLNGQPTLHDIGIFNNTHFFSYIASFGAFTKVTYATPQWLKNKLGHFAYYLDGIKRVGDIHPYRVKVNSDNFETEDEFIFGCITNSTSVGGLFQLNSADVCLNDGKFEVLLIRYPRNPMELRSIIKGLIHRKYDERYVLFFHTDHITFQFEKMISWVVDGEFAGQIQNVTIKNKQNVISFIQ